MYIIYCNALYSISMNSILYCIECIQYSRCEGLGNYQIQRKYTIPCPGDVMRVRKATPYTIKKM